MKFDVSYQAAMFYIGIAAILFVKSESQPERQTSDQQIDQYNVQFDNLVSISGNSIRASTTPLETTPLASKTVTLSPNESAPHYSSELPQLSSYILSLMPKKQVKCEPLNRRFYGAEVADIFSPDIFLQIDPFRYLIDKTMKIRPVVFKGVCQRLNYHLQADELPRCYVPYAKALSSILRCWPDLDTAKTCITYIQKMISKNAADFSFLPFDTSLFLSPQLLQLFSGEIFGDPTPPLRIFYKLINMPKNEVLNLDAPLRKFFERALHGPNIPYRNRQYIRYARAVWNFLHNESAFDDLKRNMAEIQRLANSGQRFLPATSTV